MLQRAAECVEDREGVPGVPRAQARNNGQRVLRGVQHDDVAVREEPEVPAMTTPTLSCDVYTTRTQQQGLKSNIYL